MSNPFSSHPEAQTFPLLLSSPHPPDTSGCELVAMWATCPTMTEVLISNLIRPHSKMWNRENRTYCYILDERFKTCLQSRDESVSDKKHCHPLWQYLHLQPLASALGVGHVGDIINLDVVFVGVFYTTHDTSTVQSAVDDGCKRSEKESVFSVEGRWCSSDPSLAFIMKLPEQQTPTPKNEIFSS